MSWLSGWSYRKSHVINYAAGAGTLYQVKVIVRRETGTDSGDTVYVGTKCRTDFGDIRFTDDDKVTLLDYWLESVVGVVATFWVEVADDLSTVNQTIYIYYGKADATYPFGADQAQMDATFLFADHFYGTTLNTAKWNQTALGVSVADSNLQVVGANAWNVRGVGSIITFDRTIGRMFEFSYRTTIITGTFKDGMCGYSPFPLAYTVGWNFYDDVTTLNWRRWVSNVGTILQAVAANTRYRLGLYLKPSTGWTCWIDGILRGDAATFTDTGRPIAIQEYRTDARTEIDWIFVRKFVDPEPSHGAWGNEESILTLTVVSSPIQTIPFTIEKIS